MDTDGDDSGSESNPVPQRPDSGVGESVGRKRIFHYLLELN